MQVFLKYFIPNQEPTQLWLLFTVARVSQNLGNKWLRNLCLMVRQTFFFSLRSLLCVLSQICLLRAFHSLCITGSCWLDLKSLVPDAISVSGQKGNCWGLTWIKKKNKVSYISFWLLFLDPLFIATVQTLKSEEYVSVFGSATT